MIKFLKLSQQMLPGLTTVVALIGERQLEVVFKHSIGSVLLQTSNVGNAIDVL
jgi:hypothetical protein